MVVLEDARVVVADDEGREVVVDWVVLNSILVASVVSIGGIVDVVVLVVTVVDVEVGTGNIRKSLTGQAQTAAYWFVK